MASLRSDIASLKLEIDSALEDINNGDDANYLTALKLILLIIQKFTQSIQLMSNLKFREPLCQGFDPQQMLDILLPNIKNLIDYENWTNKPKHEEIKARLSPNRIP